MTQVYCWRSVAVFCVDDGVVVCASNAEWIVVIKTKIKNFLSIKSVEVPPPVFAGGGLRFELCRYLAQQWPPGQHLAPVTAISALRRRSRRADRGQSNNHHQKVLHESSLLLNSIKSRSLRERADTN